MNKDTIKRIDAVLGTVVCFLLTLHRRLVDSFAPHDPGPVRKILFLKLIEQGATVLAAPAIQAAVARVGRENVYFCVFRENRPILDILDLVPADNVIEVRHDTFSQFIRDAFSALRLIRRHRIDTVVDMEFLARAPAILAYLTGAARRVGLHRFTAEGPYRGDLMTHRVQHNPYLHTSMAYQLLVDALDEDPTDLPLLKVPAARAELEPPPYTPSAAETARVLHILEDGGLRGAGPLVILNPNTGDLLPLRTWPIERFVALGQRILAEHDDVTLILTGAPSERAGVEDICRRIGTDRVLSVAGKTTLREVIVLYTLADVLVTNDSGPGHFASMTGIHDIVLFGPETPVLFGPLGENRHVLWAQLACSPCVNPYNHRFSPCTNNKCMQAISTEEVYRTVASCLAARRVENEKAG
ncbi:MAG: glycosyltransferase family 9 protein [Pseudomonadota bacterium]|nr:glycosyltransferase family 9 protein [Pseudomonadota bacterium]